MKDINILITTFPTTNVASCLQNLLTEYRKGEINRKELLTKFFNSTEPLIKMVCNAIDTAEGRPNLPWDGD